MIRSPLRLLLSWINTSNSLSCSSYDLPSRWLTSFVALPWTPSSTSKSSLYWGAQTWAQFVIKILVVTESKIIIAIPQIVNQDRKTKKADRDQRGHYCQIPEDSLFFWYTVYSKLLCTHYALPEITELQAARLQESNHAFKPMETS